MIRPEHPLEVGPRRLEERYRGARIRSLAAVVWELVIERPPGKLAVPDESSRCSSGPACRG